MSRYFYNGKKLRRSLDANGKKPEIYIVESNRSDGKTTDFILWFLSQYREEAKQTIYLYRYKYEIKDVAEKLFGGIKHFDEYRNTDFTAVTRMSGLYAELYMDKKLIGYAVSINSADKLKTTSHVFNDVSYMFLDEFESETDNYCTDEVQKVMSIHASVARGYGQHTRYVPLFLCGNFVTILNPYFYSLGITQRLNYSVKWLRGDGWVFQRNFNEEASKAMVEESSFNRAFNFNGKHNAYLSYLSELKYLRDNNENINKNISTDGYNYYMSLRHENEKYTVWYNGSDFVVSDKGFDESFPVKVTTGDASNSFVSLDRSDYYVHCIRTAFHNGLLTFRTLQCKNAIIALIHY